MKVSLSRRPLTVHMLFSECLLLVSNEGEEVVREVVPLLTGVNML